MQQDKQHIQDGDGELWTGISNDEPPMIHAKDKKIIEGELLLKKIQQKSVHWTYFLIMQFLSATDISGKIHTSICTTLNDNFNKTLSMNVFRRPASA